MGFTVFDVSGFIFRAFYALPPLLSPQGEPIGAVLGFGNMLLKWQESQGVTPYAVAAFDAPGRGWRHEIYPLYKDKRKEADPQLIPQFPLVRQLCECLALPCVQVSGWEADDIMASVAATGRTKDMPVILVSSDKDLNQMVGQGVSQYDPLKNIFLDEILVREKWGVRPEQIPHVQALAGDASDGIPGIPGIGPKTGARWIAQFETLEGLLANISSIPSEKKQDLLRTHAEQARLCYDLATLQENVPLPDLETLRWGTPDWQALEDFLMHHGMKKLWERFAKGQEKGQGKGQERLEKSPESKAEITQIGTKESKKETKGYSRGNPEAPLASASEHSKTLSWLGAETTRWGTLNDPQFLHHITHRGQAFLYYAAHLGTFWASDGQGWITPVDIDTARHLSAQAGYEKIIYDLKTWIGLMEAPDLAKKNHSACPVQRAHDLCLMAYDLYGPSWTKHEDTFREKFWQRYVIQDMPVIDTTPSQPQYVYDFLPIVFFTMAQAYGVFMQEVRQGQLLRVYAGMDLPLCWVLHTMERQGICVQRGALEALGRQWERDSATLAQGICAVVGYEFNVASSKQLGEALFDHLGWPQGTRGHSGAYSTDIDVLTAYEAKGYTLATQIIQWRHLSKLKDTYTHALADHIHEDGRLHTHYSQHVTSTGRLACAKPNLQTIPMRSHEGEEIRKCFHAPEGHVLLCLDYSQIELRLLAHMGPVSALVEAFCNHRDIHQETAARLFSCPLDQVSKAQRILAKGVNFGILYGISAFGLARQLGIPAKEARLLMQEYHSAYPEVRPYMERCWHQAQSQGYVTTLYNRRCWISHLEKGARFKASALRQAANAPLQGSASDIMKMALLKVHSALEDAPHLGQVLLHIHDELVIQVPEHQAKQAIETLVPLMEQVAPLNVPLVVNPSLGRTLLVKGCGSGDISLG